MKLWFTLLLLGSLNGVITAVNGLTTQQAVCEKLVVDKVRVDYQGFVFPSDTTSQRNLPVLLCPHKEAISGAINDIANELPACKSHLDLALSNVEGICTRQSCQQKLQDVWDGANITGIDHVNFDERPEPGQLSIMCKHSDMVLSSMDSVGAELPECKAVFEATRTGLATLCADVRCITLVDDTLTSNNAETLPTTGAGEWEGLCAKQDALTSALRTVAQAVVECATRLNEARTTLESVCLKKKCQTLLVSQWDKELPSLQSMSARNDMSAVSDSQQDEVCSKTKEVVEGMDAILKLHTECNAYVGISQASLDETCTNAYCARQLNLQLSLTRSYVAYLYPTAGEWSPAGKSADDVNAVCGSKEQLVAALNVIQTRNAECTPYAKRAVDEMNKGCKSAGTACDKCLLGVSSLIRLLPQVDTVVQSRFAGDHCEKIEGVARSLGACERVCTADPNSMALARNVVSHAREELGRDGECDVVKLDNVANTYDGVMHDSTPSDTIITATLSVLGVAGLVIGTAIAKRRRSNTRVGFSSGHVGGGGSYVTQSSNKFGINKVASSYQSSTPGAASSQMSVNPMFGGKI
jgi:hypothetical protein